MSSSELRLLVHAVVQEAREAVAALRQRRTLVSRHWGNPTLGKFDGGLPNVSHSHDGPTNYAGLFKLAGAGDYDIAYESLSTLRALHAHIASDERLRSRVLLPSREDENEEFRQRLNSISVALIPLGLLDRLMNCHGEHYGDVAFEEEWGLLGRWLLAEGDLPVEVVVPLAMTACEADGPFELGPDVRVERIPDGEHLARVPEHVFGAEAHPCVISAASHAAVFGGISMPAVNPMFADVFVPGVVPNQEIEQTFQDLQLASGLPLGYAQIYLRPLGWAWAFRAELPPVINPQAVRRYPSSFNDRAWNRKPMQLTIDHLEAARELQPAVVTAEPRMALAARRFGQAQRRDEIEDAVLDLCIALEAALGDAARSEMTHKISMRAAVLLASGGADPVRVKLHVKRLYDWRSALVHGADVDKPIKRFGGEGGSAADALSLANTLTRLVLASMLRRTDVVTGSDLDRMMLEALDSGARRKGEGASSQAGRAHQALPPTSA
jgi:hypothetical protein